MKQVIVRFHPIIVEIPDLVADSIVTDNLAKSIAVTAALQTICPSMPMGDLDMSHVEIVTKV